MKYLYIRLHKHFIFTFKSVETTIEEGEIRVCFNGTEGRFIRVKNVDEAEKIVDDIMYYLQQDTAKHRILDLSDYGLKEIM